MKRNSVLSVCLCILLSSITLGGENDPFEVAIHQIDAQSKELHQTIIHTQQDGLSNQKAQRLELELATIKSDHAQEIAALKTGYEEHLKKLKNEIAQAQKVHTLCPSTIKKLQKELEDARQEIVRLKAKWPSPSAGEKSVASSEKEYAQPTLIESETGPSHVGLVPENTSAQ